MKQTNTYLCVYYVYSLCVFFMCIIYVFFMGNMCILYVYKHEEFISPGNNSCFESYSVTLCLIYMHLSISSHSDKTFAIYTLQDF